MYKRFEMHKKYDYSKRFDYNVTQDRYYLNEMRY